MYIGLYSQAVVHAGTTCLSRQLPVDPGRGEVARLPKNVQVEMDGIAAIAG